MKTFWVATLMALLAADSSVANGVHGVGDGWLLGRGGAASFLQNRSAYSAGLWATVGQSVLYQMNEFPAIDVHLGARLGAGWANTTLVAGWQVLGKGLFVQQSGRLHLQWGQGLAVGVAGSLLQTKTGGDDGFSELRSQQWRLNLTGKIDWEIAGSSEVRAEIWLPIAASIGDKFVPARTRLLRLQGWYERVAFGLVVDLKANHSPTAGLEWDLAWGAAALGLRVDPSTGIVGPVVYLCRAGVLVQTSHLVHPQLGVTHRFQIGLGNWSAARW